MQKHFCAFLLIVWTVCAAGQTYTGNYEHYSVKNGLPSQSVYAVLQDRQGFLWIGTDAGVSRYDGRNFINYTTRDGLGDNEILDIYEDGLGRVWFKPFTGRLSYYYNNTIYCDHNDAALNTIQNKYIDNNILIEDINGTIYIPAYSEPLVWVLKPDHSVVQLDISDRVGKGDTVVSVFSSSDKKHLYCYTARNRLINLAENGPDTMQPPGIPQAFSGVFASNGLLYFNDKGVYSLEDNVFRFLVSVEDIGLIDKKQTNHTDVLMDKHRNIWLCNIMGHTIFCRYAEGRYLPGIAVFEDMQGLVSFDREDNIWLYDNHNGLYKVSYERFIDQYSEKLNRRLLRKKILAAFADSRGNVWLGYSNGWVSRIANGKTEHFDLNTKAVRSNRIIQIAEDKNGYLWFGTDRGIMGIEHLTSGKHRVLRRNNRDEASVKQVFLDTAGQAYIAAFGNVMQLIPGHGSFTSSLYVNDTARRGFSAFFSSDNSLYKSDLRGLTYIKNHIEGRLYLEDMRFKSRIQHFAESRGVIFIATYSNGLMAIKNNRIIASITYDQGIPGIICRRVYARHDTLYLASNGGISTLLFDGKSFRLIRNITVSDGLLSNDVYDICFLRTTMYAGTAEGLSVIHLPLKKWVQAKPPVVSILGFEVNNKNYPVNRQIEMPYARQHIRVRFVAPVMDRPELILYRYRFAGRDKDWVVTAGSNIEYSDLPHGKYRLEIQAKKYNSDWSTSAIINLTIHPPFYNTWWFTVMLLVSLAVLIWSMFRSVLRRRLRQQLAELKEKEAVEKERQRIAADIHDDIGAELTNMVMLSGMLKSKNEPSLVLIDKLESSSHEIINKMNEIIWMLNTANDSMFSLVSYLNRYAENYFEGSGIGYTVTISEQLYNKTVVTSEFRRNLFLVYKECLHNVFRHSKAGMVDIAITGKDSSLCLIISDNGSGFDPGLRYNGNGLLNMKKRTEAIKGILHTESAQGKGSVTTITVPYKK